MTAENFVDLGAGWFLYENPDARLTVVCDALSEAPDRCFGPQAWQGRSGPLSGRAILEAHAVYKGRWDQIGPSEWKWFSEDGQQFDEPPFAWPRAIDVKSGELEELLGPLSGRTVSTHAELVELVREITHNLPQRDLPCVETQTRASGSLPGFDLVPDEGDGGKWQSYRILHKYDLGDQSVTIEAPRDFDVRRAAVYMQFKAEEWFGEASHCDVTNLGIAAGLISFYGCKFTWRSDASVDIDMYAERADRCGPGAAVLMADPSMSRDGLREFLERHLDGE